MSEEDANSALAQKRKEQMEEIKNRGNNAIVDAFKKVFNPADEEYADGK